MANIIESLCWDGIYVDITMFALFPQGKTIPIIQFDTEVIKPNKTSKPYELIDEFEIINSQRLVIYDIRLDSNSSALEEFLAHCLNQAINFGAKFAWLELSDTFNIVELFSPKKSQSIYGYFDGKTSPIIRLDDIRIKKNAWANLIKQQRHQLGINILN